MRHTRLGFGRVYRPEAALYLSANAFRKPPPHVPHNQSNRVAVIGFESDVFICGAP